jgi:hypothetical protein
MQEMTDQVQCPYCPISVTGTHLLKHIFSKHEKAFFHKRNIDLLHQHGHIISKTCPPFFYMNGNGTQEYFCCFGCMKAVKKEPFATRHFPKCFEEHKTKLLSLMAKYPLDVSGNTTVVNTVVQTKIITTTTTIKFGDGNSMAFLSAYHRELEEARHAEKTQYKRMMRMREHWKRTHPELLDEWDDVEAEISSGSEGDQDPNEILEESAKGRNITLPKIKKETDVDGLLNLRV